MIVETGLAAEMASADPGRRVSQNLHCVSHSRLCTTQVSHSHRVELILDLSPNPEKDLGTTGALGAGEGAPICAFGLGVAHIALFGHFRKMPFSFLAVWRRFSQQPITAAKNGKRR